MLEENKNKNTSGQAPRKYYLFLNFSILSLISFVIVGYLVFSAIRPAITNFVISRQEADTVVFVNRFANNLLQSQDFTASSTPESEARLAVFVEGLQISARLAVFVVNREGRIIASDIPETIGNFLKRTPELERAIEDRRSVAVFTQTTAEEKELLGITDAFEMFIPITFGASTEVAGVVHSISRTGFIRETIRTVERDIIIRIVLGLLFLYFVLSFIVWGASRTIRRQAGELAEYTTTLEGKVKERTRELEKSNARELASAQEVARLKDEFLFVATHDIRAPVTSIRWSLDNLKRDREFLESMPASAKKLFNIISVSFERLHALVVDLLNVSRLESGMVKIEKMPLSVAEVLEPCVKELLPLAQEKKVTIEYPEDQFENLPKIVGDPVRLREVFTNLLSNAIKFNKEGGVVKWGARSLGNFLEISVKDTGLGVKNDNLRYLFTKFFRERETIEGTGLGLWIAAEIMRRLDGSIIAESEEGKGSTFTVKIPIVHS